MQLNAEPLPVPRAHRQPSIAISAPQREMQSAQYNEGRSVLVDQFIYVFIDNVILTSEKGEPYYRLV